MLVMILLVSNRDPQMTENSRAAIIRGNHVIKVSVRLQVMEIDPVSF